MFGPIAFLTASRSPMRHLVEAVQRRAKAFEIFGRAGRRQRRQRAAVERAFEGDDAIALRMALGGVIVARDLDRAFHRLGAGIAEEHEVGKALLAQPRREPLAVRALEQVRHVPEFGRLLLQRRDQMRVAMAERIDRDAGGEVEIALAIGGDQPDAFAALEGEVGPGENRKQMRLRDGCRPWRSWSWRSLKVGRAVSAHCAIASTTGMRKTKRAAFSGRHVRIILGASAKTVNAASGKPVRIRRRGKCPTSRLPR